MAGVATPTDNAPEPVSPTMVEILTPTATIATMIPSTPPTTSTRSAHRVGYESSSSSDEERRRTSIFDFPSLRNQQRNTMPGVAQKSIVVGSKAVTIHADEVESAFRANIVALLLVLSYIAVAILYYHFIEGWRVVDCIYFAMVIVTTVGYGDVVPVKTAGKAFTIFFAFYGICTIGVALGRLASWFLSRQQTIAKETTQRLLNHVDNAADQTAAAKPGDEPDNVVAVKVGRKHKRSLKRPKWLEWLLSDSNKAIAMAIVPILVSIGGGLVLGAIEGWPVLDCFYYAVITVTTVGFGDFSPQSEAGRIYAIFYLPLSVVSVAHGIGSVFEELGKRRVLKNKISMKELLAMDSDGDGKVSQLEYLSYMLVKLGKADESDITGILAQFRKLDKDGSGELDKDDLERLDRHLQREHDE